MDIVRMTSRSGNVDKFVLSCPRCAALRTELLPHDPMRSIAAGWVHADLNPPT
jgi:hypothetical protein